MSKDGKAVLARSISKEKLRGKNGNININGNINGNNNNGGGGSEDQELIARTEPPRSGLWSTMRRWGNCLNFDFLRYQHIKGQ